MSEYVKECIFCKESIKMSNQNGKWLPYNQDGNQHDCKKEKKVTYTGSPASLQFIESVIETIIF